MTTDRDIIAKLQLIFRDELDSPNLIISDVSGPNDVDGWDSLANIRIVAAVEREFSLQFDIDQIENIKSVSDIIAAIKAGS